MNPVHGGDVWDYEGRLIDFSANINPLGMSESAKRSLETWKLEYYPPPNSQRLKSGISEYLGVSEENITLGNGSVELIRDFCSLFLDKSSTALISEPTFSEYERYSKVYGKGAKPVLSKQDYTHTAEEIKGAISDDTRIIFICRPNNPTGGAISKQDLDEVLKFSLEKQIFVFLDEVFIEFSPLKSYAPLVKTYSNLFVLRSFTKFFALPGLRIGYGVGNPELIKKLENIKPPWNINIFAHDAASASLKDTGYIESTKKLIEEEKEFLTGEIEKLGVTVFESKANFLLLRYNWNSREVKKELLKEGILVRDCSSFHGLDTRFIRVSVRKREDNLKLIKALEKQARLGVKRGKDCSYYPCHFEGQDCQFCFCPFYPCGDETRGQYIMGKKGLEVWSCKDCKDIHDPDVVKKILELLTDVSLEKLDLKKRLKIKEEVMKNL